MQARYEIHTFEDLLNVLKAEPMWLEELRKLILTSDLLKLPERFEEFVQKDFKELKERVDGIEQEMRGLNDRVDGIEQEMIGLKDEVKELKQRVEKIDERLTKVESDVADLKGSDFERKVRENAPAYLGKLIRKCRVLDKAIIADQLDEALDAGRITEEEREEALSVDLVAEGYLRVEPQKKVLVVAEVSVKADKVDVERAHKRSKLVEKAFGMPTIPAVIGKKYTVGAKNKAKELQICLV